MNHVNVIKPKVKLCSHVSQIYIHTFLPTAKSIEQKAIYSLIDFYGSEHAKRFKKICKLVCHQLIQARRTHNILHCQGHEHRSTEAIYDESTTIWSSLLLFFYLIEEHFWKERVVLPVSSKRYNTSQLRICKVTEPSCS